MISNTVEYTVQENLCCGCGVCKGICPKDCISWERKNGMYLPKINEELCVRCGMCSAVCPGLGHIYESRKTAKETVTGSVLACYNAWSKDSELRHVSASGGVVSTLVHRLMESGEYDGVFCVDSYDYRKQLKTCLYETRKNEVCWSKSNVPKSRYLPVSHEDAVKYMNDNRDRKLIIIGTSCVVRGLQNVIAKLKLSREKYLFIGLFCDKVFNYNVLSYFSDTYAMGAPLEALHFKNKESGGWPGNMKFYPKDKEPFYVSKEERGKAKDYFMPERCLYCVDKLNVCADISLGDNYTVQDDSPLGSNSVILRTEAGIRAWSMAQADLEARMVSIEAIQNAQYLDGRLNHLYFGDLKSREYDLNKGIPREEKADIFQYAWKNALARLETGAFYDTKPGMIKRQIEKDSKKPNPVFSFLKRGVRFLKRRLMR